MIKKLVIVASAFVLIGIIGSAFTFKGKLGEMETIEKEVNMDEVQQVDVLLSNGAVEVTSTNSEKAKLVFKGDQSVYDFIGKVDNETLYVSAKEKGIRLFTVDLFSFGQTLRIELPEKIYQSIDIKTDNGKVNIEELEVKLLETKTDNGRIIMENIISENMKVTTSNGRILMDHIKGNINAHTSNGKIDVALTAIDQSIDLSTSNGAINIATETKPANMTMDARTDNGSIRIFGKRNWDTITGTGEHLVKLNTNNGSIKVENK